MTEPDAFRHYCRNPRCRSKLPAPVTNLREAFCARGCHTQFYRHRCIVCEREMDRITELKQLCGRKRCKSQYEALKAYQALGRYHSSTIRLSDARNPITTGNFKPDKSDRPWRQVAGPPIDVHLATIGADAVKHRRNAALIQRHHSPVKVIGGYKWPDAPTIDLRHDEPVDNQYGG